MSEKLKPCPFCGSTTAPTLMDRAEASWSYSEIDKVHGCPEVVVCCAGKKGGCGASTGFSNYDEPEEAIEAWNRRTNNES